MYTPIPDIYTAWPHLVLKLKLKYSFNNKHNSILAAAYYQEQDRPNLLHQNNLKAKLQNNPETLSAIQNS